MRVAKRVGITFKSSFILNTGTKSVGSVSVTARSFSRELAQKLASVRHANIALLSGFSSESEISLIKVRS